MKYLRQKLIMMVTMCSLIFNSGCVYLVVGGIGAVGGYIVSPDTVEGITEYDSDLVWDTAIETISILGLVEEESEDGGMILANVNGAKVTIVVIPLTPSTTKVSVKARKAYLPRISLAQDVFVKIMNRVEM